MKRRILVKNMGIASGTTMVMPSLYANINTLNEEGYPLMDLHVHITDEFTIEMAMELATERKTKFGILAHPATLVIKNDADLKKHIVELKKHPVYIGLQPMITNWITEVLKQIYYILMDPHIPLDDGIILEVGDLCGRPWGIHGKIHGTHL